MATMLRIIAIASLGVRSLDSSSDPPRLRMWKERQLGRLWTRISCSFSRPGRGASVWPEECRCHWKPRPRVSSSPFMTRSIWTCCCSCAFSDTACSVWRLLRERSVRIVVKHVPNGCRVFWWSCLQTRRREKSWLGSNAWAISSTTSIGNVGSVRAMQGENQLCVQIRLPWRDGSRADWCSAEELKTWDGRRSDLVRIALSLAIWGRRWILRWVCASTPPWWPETRSTCTLVASVYCHRAEVGWWWWWRSSHLHFFSSPYL